MSNQTILHAMRRSVSDSGNTESNLTTTESLKPESVRSHLSPYWRSCCCSIDPREARFFVLATISLGMLLMCCWLFSFLDVCDHAPVWSLVATILSLWTEPPRL